MSCLFKHTKYQPTEESWHCPKCGTTNKDGEFYIEDGPNLDCELLHKDDFVICTKCGYEASGDQVAKALIKKDNLVVCSCCKGKGYVNK